MLAMPVSRDDLEKACRILFGDQWQRSAAAALNVSERTMRYWAAGERDVPEGVRNDLVRLLRERSSQAAEYAGKLEKAA